MTAVAELSVHSEFDFDAYLCQMESPESSRLPSPGSERRNPLNESFEDRCELSEAVRKFFETVGTPSLTKVQRFTFNNIIQQRVILFKKVARKLGRLPLCLAALHTLANAPGRVIFVYKTEAKVTAIMSRIKSLNPALSSASYVSPPNAMILNDKRAVSKPYRALAFPLPRLLNLLNHKSLELKGVALVVFLEVESLLESHPADFESLVNVRRQSGRDTSLAFVSRSRHEQTQATLSDFFGDLTSFENRAP